jgi:hypothetical protein
VAASATGGSGGKLTITVQNPGSVTYTPGLGARYTATLRDVVGTAEASLVIGDVLRALARASAHYADLVVWAGVYNSSNNHGFAAGLASNGTVWEAARSHNVGAGWTAPSDATGTASANTVAGMAHCVMGTSSTQASIVCAPLDATGATVTGANLPTSAGTGAGMTGPFDTVFLEVGWRTGIGGAGGAVSVGASFFLYDYSDSGWDPFA